MVSDLSSSPSCQIVNLIEETGHFNVTNTTFDFDLFSLDESTVRKLQSYLEATATWQEVDAGVWMAAAAGVGSPPTLLSQARWRVVTSAAAVSQVWLKHWTTTTRTETHGRNTSTHEDTHHSHVALRRKREEVAEVMKGALEPLISVYSQDFHHTSLFFWVRAELWNAPPTPPPLTLLHCTHIAPALAKPILLLLLFTRTLLTQQSTPVPLPLLSAGAHFSPDILLSVSVCECVCMCAFFVCARVCMRALLRFNRTSCVCYYWLLFVRDAQVQTVSLLPMNTRGKNTHTGNLYFNHPPPSDWAFMTTGTTLILSKRFITHCNAVVSSYECLV